MYLAFLSYSSRYRDWVSSLHRDLESALGTGTIWLDEADLGPGRSWVRGIEEGACRAERIVLVATPEAFASPWVQNELNSFLAAHPHWRQEGRVQVALLVDAPLPPFLASLQHIDFRQGDDQTYAEGLRRLLGTLRGLTDPRNFPPAPAGTHAPPLPPPGLPADIRSDLVRLLTPLLGRRAARTALASCLKLEERSLEDLGSAACAASAALVLASKSFAPREAVRRVVTHALDEELPGDDREIRADLEHLLRRLDELAPASDPPAAFRTHSAVPSPPMELVHPTGTVPLGSALYVRRETDDEAEREMARAPGMVHVLGPRQTGKSSLLCRLAERARSAPGGPLVIQLNFQDDFDLTALADLKKLLVQLASAMLRAAGADPEAALEIERTALSAKAAAKGLVQSRILAAHPEGVLLAMDEVDRVVQRGGCSDDFFEMLRGWHEMGKHEPIWARLRIATCFCTEAHMVQEGAHGSPLDNVGLKCRLRDLSEQEIRSLALLHGIEPVGEILDRLTSWLGGNPYLVRRTLYALAVERYSIPRLIEEAMRATGPLGDHLERHRRHLQRRPDLAKAMREVRDHSRCGDAWTCRALEGAGLTRREGDGKVVPRCGLYRDFFTRNAP